MNGDRITTRRKTSRAGAIAAVVLPVLMILGFPAVRSVAGDRSPGLEGAARIRILDPTALERLRTAGHVDALVGFSFESLLREGGTASEAAGPSKARQESARVAMAAQKADLLAATGPDAILLRSYDALPTALVRFGSEDALLAALNDPDVLSIKADGRLAPEIAGTLPQIGQPGAVQAGYDGAGGTIAMLDTGVDYTRPEFGSCAAPGGRCKVVVATDIAPDDASTDDNGHGTWTAAIAASVAPGARIAALDIVDGDRLYDSDLVAALDWVVSHQAQYNIKVVNMSVSHYGEYHATDCRGSVLDGAIAAVRAAGILPVAAAGNEAVPDGTFTEGVSFPACVPGVVSVGAVYNTSGGPVSYSGDGVACTDASFAPDQPTCFSQTAPSLDVWAPGAFVSAGPFDGGYGTSASAPFVSGAVAVLAEASPKAGVDRIERAITGTGPVVIDSRSVPEVRAHRLDLSAALDAILQDAASTNAA